MGKVGVWKRLDLALLERTEGTQARKAVGKNGGAGNDRERVRGAGTGARRRTGGITWLNGRVGQQRGQGA